MLETANRGVLFSFCPASLIVRSEEQRLRQQHIASLKDSLILALKDAQENEDAEHRWSFQQFKISAAEIAQALFDEGAIRLSIFL